MDVCIGYLVGEHEVQASELGPDWLCPACSARLTGEVRLQERPAAPPACIGGDHPAGSRYYSCLACYGD